MAVEISVQQMALTRNAQFMDRIVAMLARVAGVVLSELSTTAHHSGRAVYAQTVVANPSQASANAGPQIVMGVNIYTKTTYDEATGVATCAATDPELESQITTLWNALAGLDTPA